VETLFSKVVKTPSLHSRWLNTLSMMENAGAKKIKNCEHPVLVNEIILKHSAEEARHAHYLKKQIGKIEKGSCPTYEKRYLLAPDQSYYYLHSLDVQVCRYLKKEFGYKGDDLKYAAYLLVTYAIEVRADELYPKYQAVLTQTNSPVNVRSIIVEEEGHLQEMRSQLKEFSPDWEILCENAVTLETRLYADWMDALQRELNLN
jgi:hypothetical protein